jgi:hypothetical protein
VVAPRDKSGTPTPYIIHLKPQHPSLKSFYICSVSEHDRDAWAAALAVRSIPFLLSFLSFLLLLLLLLLLSSFSSSSSFSSPPPPPLCYSLLTLPSYSPFLLSLLTLA